MPIGNPAAYGFQPVNALQTLRGAEDIRGARTQNALQRLNLQREQDPASMVNRARELELETGQTNLNVAQEKLQQAQIASAAPQLQSALDAVSRVKETIANRGVAAGRQRLSERLSFLQSQGILPEDFDLGVDPAALSDDEFVSEIEQTAQDLSGTLASIMPDKQARVSADIGDMQAIGMDLTPENYQRFLEMKGDSSNERMESLIQEARLMGLLQEQRQRQTDEQRAAEERVSERTAAAQEVTRNLAQNQSAVDLTQRLEGTMLESGSVIPSDMRRGLADLQRLAMSFSGRDTSDISQMIADFDTQRKILQDQVNSRIASGDYGRSATQLQSIERSLANPDISPQAIIRIQGQLAEMDLDRAEAENLDIENREQWEQRVKEWKNYDPVSASIPNMGLQQLRQLDIDSLTDEQAEAALNRLNELENGR